MVRMTNPPPNLADLGAALVTIIATVAMKYRFVLKVNHDSTPDYSIVIL